MQYRKEIDGLRAIAVLPVILFHAGFSGFSGGYIGVDIFFVISGYLITKLIIEDILNKQFAIVGFYERRARRILPALSVVLLFSTILAYIIMPADLLKLFSQSLISVTTFLSNVFFYLKSGYFSTASDEKLLIHTWSLAVEEQFYVIFPISVVLLWRFGLAKLGLIFISVAAISLAFSQFLASKQSIDANFYLIFSRAWELLAGAIIAVYALDTGQIKNWIRELLGVFGLALIAYSIFFFSDQTPFPSIYTLLPVVGACLIIIFVNTNSYVGRFLSLRVMVVIGLISYSLYLWHQPLFAILRLQTIGEPSKSLFWSAILLAFIFAALSYRYVETPFRNRKRFSRSDIFKLTAIMMVTFTVIGLLGHYNKGFKQRFKVTKYQDSMLFSPKRQECHTSGQAYLKPSDACRYFGKNITWAILGDSHTVEPAYALAKRLEKQNLGLVHLSFSGCPPSLLFKVRQPGCTEWFEEALSLIENDENINNVFLAFSYSPFLFGSHKDVYPKLPNKSPEHYYSEYIDKSYQGKPREAYWNSFVKTVERLQAKGKIIHILYPIPELPIHISKAVIPISVFGGRTRLNLHKATHAKYYFARNHYILNKLDSLSYGTDLHAIKPFDILCQNDYCPAIKDGNALYFDNNHLSLFGAELIINYIELK